MNRQDSKKIPFTEDPTQKELTAYTTFTKSPYTSKFCDHFREDELVYNVEDEISEDKAVRKANKIHVVEEKVKEGEGLIERKDLYTICQNVLGENRQNLRGYWVIEAKDSDMAKSLPFPVFQFGTLGLEIHPEKASIIKLGTWDVEIILKNCINYHSGKNIMEKVSGLGISDEKIRFKWCLRGPVIDRGAESEPEPIHRRAIKKGKEFVKDLKSWNKNRKESKAGICEDDE